MLRWKTAGGAILTTALAALAGAQEAPPVGPPSAGPPPSFDEVVDVRVVNLEVVVTDRAGERVRGLGPADFLLRVDGNEVPVEYFTEVAEGKALPPGEGAEALSLPARAPGQSVGTSVLVFVDEYFSRPEDLGRVLGSLLDHLPRLTPEDRMAVVAYDGEKLEMLSNWTSSVESLVRTFQRARLRPTSGRLRQANLDALEVFERLGFAELERGIEERRVRAELDPEELQQVELLAEQVERVVDAATGALRSFGGPPGRKVMLLLSGGWPLDPVRWVAEDPARTVLEGGGGDLFAPLVRAANRLGYTLYPVEVKPFAAPVERETEEERSLADLARRTGGQAMLNVTSDEALARVIEDTRSYYWIGFTPDWRGDDSDHRVEVEPRTKELEARARRSFQDLSREAEVTMMVESALLFGNTPGMEDLVVEAGAPTRAGSGKMRLPLAVYVPVGELTFVPRGDGYMAQAELRIAVLDENGNTLEEVPRVPLSLRIATPPKKGEFARYDLTVELRRKKHDVLVSLYDRFSETLRSTRLEVTLPDRPR